MKKTETVLTVDTSDRDKIFLSITYKGKKIYETHIYKKTTSQILLSSIEKILKRFKLSIFDLTEIKVNIGPGSFTGLRVGIAVANTLGWLLGIKVNGKKEKPVEPIY